jgi:hypothetical protein
LSGGRLTAVIAGARGGKQGSYEREDLNDFINVRRYETRRRWSWSFVARFRPAERRVNIPAS